MTDKQQLAKRLYLTQNKTQKEIAIEVGVSERTIFAWVHQFAWDKLRLAAYTAPITISGNLCSELIEMQDAISAREPGDRFPTSQEADVIRKMILCLDSMKKYPSLSQSMQVMETFRNYVRPLNPQFTKDLAHYSEEFLSTQCVNGFAPYQVEYGIEHIAPISPFYDELDGDEPCNTTTPPVQHIPCSNMENCLHPGNCNFPKCKYKAPLENNPPAQATIQIPNPEFQIPATTGSIPAIPPIENTQSEKNPAISQQSNIEFCHAEARGICAPDEKRLPITSVPITNSQSQIPGAQIPATTGSIPAIFPIENNQNDKNPAVNRHSVSEGGNPQFQIPS